MRVDASFVHYLFRSRYLLSAFSTLPYTRRIMNLCASVTNQPVTRRVERNVEHSV